MSYTKNHNLPEMPSGAIEWVAIFNDLIAKVEAGRTIKITAGEDLLAGEAVGLPDAAGKVYKVTNTGNFLGIVQADVALDAEGFAYTGLGNEITVGSGWTVGGLIYVGSVAGSLTQTPPVIGKSQAIAYANTATSIVLLRPRIQNDYYPLFLNFGQSDVEASQTEEAIPVLGAERTISGQASNYEYLMPRAGSIVGISIASNAARTNGTLTVDITINGVLTGLQAILNGSNIQYHYANQPAGLDTFVAGDRIGVKITTDGSWSPETADIVVSVVAVI